MIQVLGVSTVLLWIAVVVLAALVLALTRQVGVLHERVAPAGALMAGAGPRVGELAPRLDVVDWQGRNQRIGGQDPHGASTLLFFVSPTCPLCKALIPLLGPIERDEGPDLKVLVASDGLREEHERFVRDQQLDRRPYLLSTELGIAYAASKLPYAVLIDEAGIVRGRGLVNTREHLESLFEARDRGVASVQEFVAGEGVGWAADQAEPLAGGTRRGR